MSRIQMLCVFNLHLLVHFTTTRDLWSFILDFTISKIRSTPSSQSHILILLYPHFPFFATRSLNAKFHRIAVLLFFLLVPSHTFHTFLHILSRDSLLSPSSALKLRSLSGKESTYFTQGEKKKNWVRNIVSERMMEYDKKRFFSLLPQIMMGKRRKDRNLGHQEEENRETEKDIYM